MIITIATSNPGKVRELAALLAPEIELVAAPDGYDPPAETGETYLENARIKARALAARTGGAALGDDSGLEVDALGGRPGVHSARYGSSAAERNARLLDELRGTAGAARSARFKTVLVVVLEDGRELSCEGSCEGVIAAAPRGAGGFGYDPLFLVPAIGRTFGELPAVEKDRLSARAAAAHALLEAVKRFRR